MYDVVETYSITNVVTMSSINSNKIFSFQIKRFLEKIDSKRIAFSLYGLSYLDDEYFLSVSFSL